MKKPIVNRSLTELWSRAANGVYGSMDGACAKGLAREALVIVIVDRRRHDEALTAVGTLDDAMEYVKRLGLKAGDPAFVSLTTPAPAGETRVIGRLADLTWGTMTVPSSRNGNGV